MPSNLARVAELVDALDSKSNVSNNVPVRFRPRVQKRLIKLISLFLFLQITEFEVALGLSPDYWMSQM